MVAPTVTFLKMVAPTVAFCKMVTSTVTFTINARSNSHFLGNGRSNGHFLEMIVGRTLFRKWSNRRSVSENGRSNGHFFEKDRPPPLRLVCETLTPYPLYRLALHTTYQIHLPLYRIEIEEQLIVQQKKSIRTHVIEAPVVQCNKVDIQIFYRMACFNTGARTGQPKVRVGQTGKEINSRGD